MQRVLYCRVFEGEVANIITEIVLHKKHGYSFLKISFNSNKQLCFEKEEINRFLVHRSNIKAENNIKI